MTVIAYKCIIHSEAQKIVERKLRTRFRSGFANFLFFKPLTPFFTISFGKMTFRHVQRAKHTYPFSFRCNLYRAFGNYLALYGRLCSKA